MSGCEEKAMAWFHPAPQRVQTLLGQGLGDPGTPAHDDRLAKLVTLLSRKNPPAPPPGESWLHHARTGDLASLIAHLPPSAMVDHHGRTMLSDCPTGEEAFDRWWTAFRLLPPALRLARDTQGQHALYACIGVDHDIPRHVHRARALIDGGIDLFGTDKAGRTVMEVWLERLLDVRRCPLAVWDGFLPLVRMLVMAHGFRHLCPGLWNAHALYQTACDGAMGDALAEARMERLLLAGYPVDQRAGGESVLHLCARENLPGMARILIEHGARTRMRSKSGHTPLQLLRRHHPGNLGATGWAGMFQEHLDDLLPPARHRASARRL